MAVSGAVLGIALAGVSWPLDPAALGLAALFVLGLLSLALAWNLASRQGKRDGVRLTLYVLGTAVAILLAIVVFSVSALPVQEIVALPIVPALAVTLLGGAAALAINGSRRARRAALASTAVAALTASPVLISASERERGIELVRGTADAIEVGRVDLGASATGLQLSPRGTRFVVQQAGRGDAASLLARSVRHVVGAAGGTLRVIPAIQVAFLDDDHVIVLQAADSASELRLERADSAVLLWSARLPELFGPKLVAQPADGTWAVIGTDMASDSLVVATGTADSPGPRIHRYAPFDSLGAIDHLVFDGGARLILPSFQVRSRPSFPLALAMMSGFPSVEVWSVTADGARRVGEMDGYPQCGQPEAGQAACLVRDRSRARVWLIDASGAASPVQLTVRDAITGVPGAGARLTLSNGADRVTHIDLATRRVTDIRLPPDLGTVYEASAAGNRLAVLRFELATAQLVFLRTE